MKRKAGKETVNYEAAVDEVEFVEAKDNAEQEELKLRKLRLAADNLSLFLPVHNHHLTEVATLTTEGLGV